jgi:cation diffusion facilitator family transporter
LPNESTRTVLVSLGAGLGIALTKAAAAVITGSSAMAAEASHSFADCVNDIILFVAQRRSSHPDDDLHPLGWGREVYFWSLIAALAVLVGGAAFSLREGITELIHPSATKSYAVAYIVLAASTGFDLVSIRRSAGQMAGRARHHKRAFYEESRITSDTTLRAVLVEDSVAIAGDVLAIGALTLNQITGSSVPQGVAAVLIGLLLIRAGLLLVRRSHDFLVGAWALTAAGPEASDPEAFTQPFSQTEQQRVWTYVLQFPGVTGVREIIATFLGPRRVWLVARVDIDDDLSGAQVQELVRGIESGLKHESVVFYRVDVAVTGGDHL